MRKFISVYAALAILFSAMLASCDTEDTYTPYRIEIEAEGHGSVQFKGYHGCAQNYNLGSEVVIIAHPDKDYSFDGWYTEAEFTTEWDFNNSVDEDITLYAKWTEKVKPVVEEDEPETEDDEPESSSEEIESETETEEPTTEETSTEEPAKEETKDEEIVEVEETKEEGVKDDE